MIHQADDRLDPYLVRAATSVMRRRWRGLDPDEVYAYLHLVADELEQLQREATTARTETERIRQGLRQWQARHIGCKFADPPDPDPPAHQRPRTSRRPVDSTEQDLQARNGGHW